MTDFHRHRTAFSAAAISLALLLAAPAMGAPAGSEYLPAEPSATGGQGGGGGGGDGSGSGSTPTSSGSSDAGVGPAESKGGGGGEGEQATGSSDTISVAPAAVSDEDSSSGAFDTLLNPIVLLLAAGVVAVAVGMTLRRRQGEEEGEDGDRSLRDPATVPPTPDGEIVAGGERPS